MKTQLESLLLSSPLSSWEVEQVIVFDWYDGPLMGLCKMVYPLCAFHFELFAEYSSGQDINDRLFALREISVEIFTEAMSLLSVLGTPRQPVWVPIWKFSLPETQVQTEKRMDLLFEMAQNTDLIVRTSDMVHFSGVWLKKTENVDGPNAIKK